MTPEAPEHEQTAEEAMQEAIAEKVRELIKEMDKPKKEVSKVQVGAKIATLAAMTESAKDVSAVVWNQLGPETRVAAFSVVLGIMASTLE